MLRRPVHRLILCLLALGIVLVFVSALRFSHRGADGGGCLVAVELDGAFGAINPRGDLLIDALYESLIVSSRYAVAKKNGTVKVFGTTGELLFELERDARRLEFLNAHLIAAYGPTLAVIDLDLRGQEASIPSESRVIWEADELGWFAMQVGDRWGHYNEQFEVQIEPQFGFAYGFSEGLASVLDVETGKFGFITQDGAWAISPQFTRAEPFCDGYALVLVDDALAYIDRDGVAIELPPGKLDGARPSIWGMFPVAPENGL